MKKFKKIAGRIKKFFIFGMSKRHKRVVMPEECPGFLYSPKPDNSVITPWIDRNSPSKPSCGALTTGSVTLFTTVTQSQKPQAMNISPEELEQIKAEAERITIEDDPYLEVWAMVDPLKYRDLLLAIPN